MQNEREILDLIQTDIAAGVFPGVDFMIIEGDRHREFVLGNASVFPEKETLKTGKMWDLASVTKVVGTGTAVIDLVFSGQLNLDQPLQRYYPDFADTSVTLRELLTHTSGIDPFIANRDQLSAEELKLAIDGIKVTSDKRVHYTDLNFILLGFMLEHFYDMTLAEVFEMYVFKKWGMTKTKFAPVENAVPTALTIPVGTVHDPKAQVLGSHCGSAGLFSNLTDLSNFVQGYFSDEKYLKLQKDYTQGKQKRSLAWALPFSDENWLLHTGYTGTFILMNPSKKQSVIFLSNRVHLKDERQQWILDRDKIISLFLKSFSK